MKKNTHLHVDQENPMATLMPDITPYYYTDFGAAYLGDSAQLLKKVPSESVDLVLTSPPYALVFKKEYGNVDAKDYIEWFLSFSDDIKRVLKPSGSFVLNIGGCWNKGAPTRSLYQFELLLALAKKFHLAQEFFWYNPAKLPAPAEWVNVRRIRVKDSVEYVWWLSKAEDPKADNRRVLAPYSPDMERLIKNGYRAKRRPSGHNITSKFQKDQGGSIPPNLLRIGNTDSSSDYLKKCEETGVAPHPARFPPELPEFFIKFLTDPGDLVLDPFGGSNVTGRAAEDLKRRWLCFDLVKEYLDGSKFRFDFTY